MKTRNITVQFTSSASVAIKIPITTRVRPVRRGNLWPGEGFAAGNRKWDLSEWFANNVFILPLMGDHGTRTF